MPGRADDDPSPEERWTRYADAVDRFDHEVGQRLSNRTRNALIRRMPMTVWIRGGDGNYVGFLRRTPDAVLLSWYGIGPTALAEIRRVIPHQLQGARSLHPWWLVG